MFFLSSCEQSSDAQLTEFTVPNARVQQWASNYYVAYVQWGTEAVAPTFKEPLFAIVSPESGQYQSVDVPIVYTVTAEDGTVARCTLVVCQATLGLSYQSPTALHTRFFSDYVADTWKAGVLDSVVWMNFYSNPHLQAPDTSYGCSISYKIREKENVAGNFPAQPSTASGILPGMSFGSIHLQNSGSKHLSSITSGQLRVDSHDQEFGTITGAFDSLSCKEWDKAQFPYRLFGRFKNLPLRR